MKRFLLALCLCPLLGAAPFQRNQEQFFDYRQVSLENEFLSLSFAPDQLGRLAALKLKKNGTDLIGKFKLSRYTETPLFFLDSGNFKGVRELFWGRSLSGIAPMNMVVKTRSVIAFETKSYGSSNVALIRKVSLLPDTLIISFASVFSTFVEINHHRMGFAAFIAAMYVFFVGNRPACSACDATAGSGMTWRNGQAHSLRICFTFYVSFRVQRGIPQHHTVIPSIARNPLLTNNQPKRNLL